MGAIRRSAKGRARVKQGKPRVVRDPGGVVEVSAEQRRSLIEDLAYFRAERFRAVGSGPCREQDRREAEAEIRAVLERGSKQ